MNLHLNYPADPRKQEQSAYLDSPHALSFLEPVPLPRQVFSLPPVRYNPTTSMDQRGPLTNGMSSPFRPTNSMFGTTTLMNHHHHQHSINNQPHGPSVVQHHIIHHHHWPSQNSLTQLQGLPPPVTSSNYSLATVSETSLSDPETEQELPEPIASSNVVSPTTSASLWEATSARVPQQQQRNRHQIHGVDLDLLQIEIEPLSALEEEEGQNALYLDGLSSSTNNNTQKPKLKKTNKKKSKSAPKLLLKTTTSTTGTPSPLNDLSSTTISSSVTSEPSGAGTQTRWEERYEELKAYKERFGDCCVPSQWKENPSLAQWTKRQRYQLRLRKYGKHSTMTAARETLLEQLDFCWDPHETFWNERLAELEAYREEHGHVRYMMMNLLCIFVPKRSRLDCLVSHLLTL